MAVPYGVNVHVNPNADYSACGYGKLALDPMLQFTNGLGDFDLGSDVSQLCWPGGNPANGAVIPDLAQLHNLSFALTAANVVSYSGSGFDFSAVANNSDYISIPSNALAAIWAQPNQYFLAIDYIKTPSSANWPNGGTSMTFFETGDYTAEACLCRVNMQTTSGNKRLVARRQTALNTEEALLIDLINSTDFSALTQLAMWRDASGTHFSVTTPGPIVYTAAPVIGIENPLDFSGKPVRFGIAPVTNYWSATLASTQLTGRIHKQYAGSIAGIYGLNLNIPALLLADYKTKAARGVFL